MNDFRVKKIYAGNNDRVGKERLQGITAHLCRSPCSRAWVLVRNLDFNSAIASCSFMSRMRRRKRRIEMKVRGANR